MFRRRDRLVRESVRARFVVTLATGGPPFSGVLLETDDRSAVFADVRLIAADGEQPAQGQLYVDRAHIAYMQRL